jgi:hypothetical protein
MSRAERRASEDRFLVFPLDTKTDGRVSLFSFFEKRKAPD